MCETHGRIEPKALPKKAAGLRPNPTAFLQPAARSLPLRKSRNMNTLTTLPGLRVRAENENHHLWNNHGTWFLHYTVHPTPFTKERVRRSLGTKDVRVARERRDTFFAQLATETTKAAAQANKAVAA